MPEISPRERSSRVMEAICWEKFRVKEPRAMRPEMGSVAMTR